MWIADFLVIDDTNATGVRSVATVCTIPFVAFVSQNIRLEYTHTTGPSLLQLWWAGNFTALQIVPLGTFDASTTQPELKRQAMRDRMYAPAVQWGTYHNPTMGDHVHMPSGFALQTTLADLTTQAVLGDIIVFRDASPAITTVGPHSYNGSDFSEVQLDAWNGRECSVLLQSTVVNGGADLQFLATANGSACDGLALLVQPGMLWGHYGEFSVPVPGTFRAQMPGFAPITAFSANGTGVPFPNANASEYWALPFSSATGTPVVLGFSTGTQYSISKMQANVAAARARQVATFSHYGNLSQVYEAMQTVMAWNTIYTPYEGVITPVSRGWDFGSDYVLFHWDNELAAYMLALEAPSLDISFSNLIQIIQARTLSGMIPNYASGTRKSYDRTEPQLGSYILREIYQKWNESWVVEIVFDSLLGAHNWTWDHRRGAGVLASSDLIVLGSDETVPPGDWATNTMQGARYESGQDNSPMYDGVDNGLGPVAFDNVTQQMLLYDVGMTSFFLMDTEALIYLAGVVGRTEVIPTLQARFNTVQASLNAHLWDASAGMYTNMLYNGSFYSRYSPTSFFPLISGSASDTQAEELMGWLASPQGFCVNATHTGPQGSAMLVQYWDGTHDNCECLSDACIKKAVLSQYAFVRIEALGLLANASGPTLLALNQFYSAANGDNLLTTDCVPPSDSYTFVRVEGYCFAAPAPGLVPLTLWWSEARKDYKVCGDSLACIDDDGNYTLVKTICYAYNATGLDNLPCKYGVPSIARSDPAFWDNGYWRGRIWGPHLQLVYWGLRRYSHLPSVAAVRAVLVKQSRQLLLDNWRLFRHVNENSNGITGTGEASYSDWFYHWGALAGFLSFEEEGWY